MRPLFAPLTSSMGSPTTILTAALQPRATSCVSLAPHFGRTLSAGYAEERRAEWNHRHFTCHNGFHETVFDAGDAHRFYTSTHTCDVTSPLSFSIATALRRYVGSITKHTLTACTLAAHTADKRLVVTYPSRHRSNIGLTIHTIASPHNGLILC
jgi:hypothetical protein